MKHINILRMSNFRMGVRLIHERNFEFILERHDELTQEDEDEEAVKTRGTS